MLTTVLTLLLVLGAGVIHHLDRLRLMRCVRVFGGGSKALLATAIADAPRGRPVMLIGKVRPATDDEVTPSTYGHPALATIEDATGKALVRFDPSVWGSSCASCRALSSFWAYDKLNAGGIHAAVFGIVEAEHVPDAGRADPYRDVAPCRLIVHATEPAHPLVSDRPAVTEAAFEAVRRNEERARARCFYEPPREPLLGDPDDVFPWWCW